VWDSRIADDPYCLLEGYTHCCAILRDCKAGLVHPERTPMVVGVTPRTGLGLVVKADLSGFLCCPSRDCAPLDAQQTCREHGVCLCLVGSSIKYSAGGE